MRFLMADVLTPEQRKLNMSRIRCEDTRPEMVVRSLVHRMGYRYSLHNRHLQGKPDIVLHRYRKIIFVHGCFWHMHRCKYGRVIPETNRSFWEAKRRGNVDRDRRAIKALKRDGWKVLVVWECSTRKEGLSDRLRAFLET